MNGPSYAWTTIDVGERLAMGYSYRLASKRLVVMLHGLGCTRVSYNEAWADPSLADYSLMCLDYVGFGQTSPPEKGEADCHFHAKTLTLVLEAFLERYPHDEIFLVGHSMGAAIPLLCPKEFWARIKGLAFVEGNLIAEDCFFSRGVAAEAAQGFDKVVPESVYDLTGDMRGYFFLENTKPKPLFETAASVVALTDDGTFLKLYEALSVPKRYFKGEHSQVPDFIKDACEIPNSGHFLMNENAPAFYGALAEWFESLD